MENLDGKIVLTTEELDTIIKETYKTGVEDSQKKNDNRSNGYLKKLEKEDFHKHIKKNYGSFYFSFYNKVIDILEPQYLVRALYLCSFLNYDNNLFIKKHKRMYLKDLQCVLMLQEKETRKTKNELFKNNILIINEDKSISINEKFFKKGDIMKNGDKARIFDKSIKELYENATPREHKKLALLYRLIPYVNNNWNIVCKNVHEEDRNNIEPYTLKELSEVLGVKNVTRFKNDLLKITIDGVPAVMIQLVFNTNRILINPKIYYKGTRYDDVKVIEDDIKEIVKNKVNINNKD